ncbi:MAG: hypothetical protein KDA79_03045 [Planctomycetaceae bacterium]|nr:hypothetical protein [Planctomycetaceae bacterium]
MEVDADVAEVYQRLLEHCEEYECNPPWPFRDPHAFRGPVDAGGTLVALQSEFSLNALEQSGVVVFDRSGSGEPVLNPAVVGRDAVLVALRGSEGAPPFELLTAAGNLSGTSLPVEAVLDDEPTSRMLLEFNDNLCVGFTIADVAALRAAGVPATLATGLDDLSGHVLRRVGPRFGLEVITADTSVAPMPERQLQMVLVGWSPAEPSLDQPTGLGAVREHFTLLDRHLGVSVVEHVAAWHPSAEELQALLFRLRHGEIEDVQRGLFESAESALSLWRWQGSMALLLGSPTDYATAVSLVHEFCRGGRSDESLRRKAWEKFEAALERDVVEPLIRDALAERDPSRREAMLARAEIARVFHMQMMQAGQRLGERIREHGAQGTIGLSEKEMRKLSGLADRLVKIAREAGRPSSGTSQEETDLHASGVD